MPFLLPKIRFIYEFIIKSIYLSITQMSDDRDEWDESGLINVKGKVVVLKWVRDGCVRDLDRAQAASASTPWRHLRGYCVLRWCLSISPAAGFRIWAQGTGWRWRDVVFGIGWKERNQKGPNLTAWILVQRACFRVARVPQLRTVVWLEIVSWSWWWSVSLPPFKKVVQLYRVHHRRRHTSRPTRYVSRCICWRQKVRRCQVVGSWLCWCVRVRRRGQSRLFVRRCAWFTASLGIFVQLEAATWAALFASLRLPPILRFARDTP